ncbi:MAG: hypothetical protein ACFFCW_13170, partial [Candidatus Hodarchaeota archaeon]
PLIFLGRPSIRGDFECPRRDPFRAPAGILKKSTLWQGYIIISTFVEIETFNILQFYLKYTLRNSKRPITCINADRIRVIPSTYLGLAKIMGDRKNMVFIALVPVTCTFSGLIFRYFAPR